MTHSLGAKAALILGLKFRALDVNISDGYGLRGATFQNALSEDRANGDHPFTISTQIGH